MSGVTALLPPRAAYTTEAIYRLSVEQYHDLIAAGTLTEDDPVELIEGLLVYRMPKNKPHTAAVRRLRQAITPLLLPADFVCDAEQPISLRDSETEPDGLVVRGRIQNFDTRPVQPSDLSLVIEVSDPTLTRGRTVKLRSYARAAVPCYWIVNLIDRQIERHTDPDPAADPPSYRTPTLAKPGELLSLPTTLHPTGQLAVDDMLPPAEPLGIDNATPVHQ